MGHCGREYTITGSNPPTFLPATFSTGLAGYFISLAVLFKSAIASHLEKFFLVKNQQALGRLLKVR